nr:hypothetical protein [Nonomuraea wenchangensis]
MKKVSQTPAIAATAYSCHSVSPPKIPATGIDAIAVPAIRCVEIITGRLRHWSASAPAGSEANSTGSFRAAATTPHLER